MATDPVRTTAPTHHAQCRCGRVRIVASGDPVRVSACHCLACKKRTGSAFSVQARWPEDSVRIDGDTQAFTRTADSGNPVEDHFCPGCGATVHFMTRNLPGLVAIPLGLLDDPAALAPTISIYERSKPDWVEICSDGIAHRDTTG